MFPYYTDDKITEAAETTGSKTVVLVEGEDRRTLWLPFSEQYRGSYNLERNLYKNAFGNKVIFEEINHDLGLSFQYQWAASERFGFARHAKLTSTQAVKVSLLDGIQNVLPYGVPEGLQRGSSNLVDAYKKCELEEDNLGIYALSAIISDKAEPSEALKANVVWSIGLDANQGALVLATSPRLPMLEVQWSRKRTSKPSAVRTSCKPTLNLRPANPRTGSSPPTSGNPSAASSSSKKT